MLVAALAGHARQQPRKAALVHNGSVWGYAEFAARIAAARRHWAAQEWVRESVGQGTVVLGTTHLADAWVQGIALRALGLTTIGLPPDLGIARLPLGGQVAVMVTGHAESAGFAEQARARGWAVLPMPAASAQAHDLLAAADDAGRADSGHIVMTSGTTGAHKRVLRASAGGADTHRVQAAINGITADSVVYAGEFPHYTAGGYGWPLLTWMQGGTVLLHQGSGGERTLADWRASHLYATPQTLLALLKAAPDALPRNDAMRVLVTGGSLPGVLARELRQRLSTEVFTVFASTEAQTVAVSEAVDDGSVQRHRIHPTREVQVVDAQGQPLPRGEMGEVRIRLLEGMNAYLHDDEANARYFRDGFFYPGDLGSLDADGALRLHGRVTEVLNLLGDKRPIVPIEERLRERLGVEAVCLFGGHEAEGEVVHVAIQNPRPPSAEMLGTLLREALGHWFVRIHYHCTTALPRNAMGKVQRDQLQRQFLKP